MDQSKQSFWEGDQSWLTCFDPSTSIFFLILILASLNIPTGDKKVVSKMIPAQVHRKIENMNILSGVSEIQTHIEIGIIKDRAKRLKDYFWKKRN